MSQQTMLGWLKVLFVSLNITCSVLLSVFSFTVRSSCPGKHVWIRFPSDFVCFVGDEKSVEWTEQTTAIEHYCCWLLLSEYKLCSYRSGERFIRASLSDKASPDRRLSLPQASSSHKKCCVSPNNAPKMRVYWKPSENHLRSCESVNLDSQCHFCVPW